MIHIKQAFLHVTLGVVAAGCANIPKAESPLEVCSSFPASFEKVWSASLGTVQAVNGTVLAQDKAGRLIACKMPSGPKGAEEYLNISIVPPGPNQLVCCVYVVPYAFSVGKSFTQLPSPEGSKVILMAEFTDVNFHKNHLSEISNAFFDGLAQRVGRGKL